jgi:hypothetical protein
MNRRHFFTLALSATITPSVIASQDDSATITHSDGLSVATGATGATGASGPMGRGSDVPRFVWTCDGWVKWDHATMGAPEPNLSYRSLGDLHERINSG